VVGQGEIYSLQTLDPSAYSGLGADGRQVLKQGIVNDPVILALSGPGTIGYSVNYLIEVAFSETDTDSVVLPYCNVDDPDHPYSGPAGSGSPQATTRQDGIIIQAKMGVAAATGTETVPAVDAGYTALWVVTIDYGQTKIGSDHISQVSGAPIITERLGDKISQARADLRYIPFAAESLTGAPGKIPYGDSEGMLDESWVPVTTPQYISRQYPEILTAGNVMALTGTIGSVTLAAGQQFVIRDMAPITTAAQSFNTYLNRTYHLRYAFAIGSAGANMGASFYEGKSIAAGSFYLIDTADTNYNPSSLEETNPTFDTKRDDMLVARIVTDESNNPTITPLANAQRLLNSKTIDGEAPYSTDNWSGWSGGVLALNWARTPIISVPALSGICSNPFNPQHAPGPGEWNATGLIGMAFVRVTTGSLSRYGATLDYAFDGRPGLTDGWMTVSWFSEA
jgi:hypothetical protein